MRTMKDIKAQAHKPFVKTANKKESGQKTKSEPLARWEGEGGALDPDSGLLADLTGQSELAQVGRRNNPAD